jgi:hypothetical protein
MDELADILENMEPEAAASAIAEAARAVFPLLTEAKRRALITGMLGEPGEDKVVGLVHL